MKKTMLWLIALLVVGIIMFIGYRLYYYPPLTRSAKQQRENYLRRLQWDKTLIYQMSSDQIAKLLGRLSKSYFNAGSGCYYGTGVMIYLKITTPQIAISLFSPTEDNLVRYTWKLMQMKNKIGGN